jgi:muconate cycloisomerase
MSLGEDVEGLHRRLNAALPPADSNPIAKSALDMALFDLLSRRAGQSLREYLGGSKAADPMALSYTVTAKDGVAASEDVAQAVARGFRHFNFKAGLKPETDREVARAVAEAAPSGAFLWADANQGFDLEGARAAAGFLQDEGIHVLEQPLPKKDFEGMRKLRAATAMRLAVDEACVSQDDFRKHISEKLVDFLVVKITRSGGIGPSLDQIALAKAANLPLLLSGLTDSFLVKLAACQLMSVFGFTGPAALNGSQFLDESALFPSKGDWEKAGSVNLPPGPGIGLSPDEGILKDLSLWQSMPPGLEFQRDRRNIPENS